MRAWAVIAVVCCMMAGATWALGPHEVVVLINEESTDTTYPAEKPSQDQVTVPLGEVFSWLVDALRNGRTWLSDFEDDEVTISSDLYEVILAYQHYRRPSA